MNLLSLRVAGIEHVSRIFIVFDVVDIGSSSAINVDDTNVFVHVYDNWFSDNFKHNIYIGRPTYYENEDEL